MLVNYSIASVFIFASVDGNNIQVSVDVYMKLKANQNMTASIIFAVIAHNSTLIANATGAYSLNNFQTSRKLLLCFQ